MAHKFYIVRRKSGTVSENIGEEFETSMRCVYHNRIVDLTTFDVQDTAVRIDVNNGGPHVRIIGRPRKLDSIRKKIEEDTGFVLEAK